MIRFNHEEILRTIPRMFSNFYDAFIPDYQQYRALDAVGGLSYVSLAGWMPIAFLLSLIALCITIFKTKRTTPKPNQKEAEVGAGDAEEAV